MPDPTFGEHPERPVCQFGFVTSCPHPPRIQLIRVANDGTKGARSFCLLHAKVAIEHCWPDVRDGKIAGYSIENLYRNHHDS
jgi:hypothetical protein